MNEHVDTLVAELHEEFDKMLDSVYGNVAVMGELYPTSTVLKALDSDRYDSEYNEWLA